MYKKRRYHIATTPETVQSLLKDGVFPDDLPAYVLPRTLQLVDIFSKSIIRSHTKADQIFIVELSGPNISRQGEVGDEIDVISVNEVTRIFVYSGRAHQLFKTLIGKQFRKPIIIDSSLFNVVPSANEDKKRKRVEKKNADHVSSNNSYGEFEKKLKSSSSSRDNVSLGGEISDAPSDCVMRLSSIDEHARFVCDAFKRAKKKVLISSYSLKRETFNRLNLYTLMREARARGVNIYIYYSDKSNVDASILKFLENQGIFLYCTYMYSKLFIVDDHFVAVGSFDWLSGIPVGFPPICDGTIVFQHHDVCKELKDDLWLHIKRYGHIQLGKKEKIDQFDSRKENFFSIRYRINEEECVMYLPSLEQQCAYLRESFEIAERNIIICSPLISMNSVFFENFDANALRQSSSKGVHVIFVCNANDRNLGAFKQFLETNTNPLYVHLVVESGVHLRTIIVDDKEICDGAFNLLSTVLDGQNNYQNHEAVCVVSGDLAEPLISHFYDSPIGQAIYAHYRELCLQGYDWPSSSSESSPTPTPQPKKRHFSQENSPSL